MAFLNPSKQIPVQYLKSGHNCFFHILYKSLFTKHRLIHYYMTSVTAHFVKQTINIRHGTTEIIHEHTDVLELGWLRLDN
jgi:hypothetical protein